jgi:hypothetical protein
MGLKIFAGGVHMNLMPPPMPKLTLFSYLGLHISYFNLLRQLLYKSVHVWKLFSCPNRQD